MAKAKTADPKSAVKRSTAKQAVAAVPIHYELDIFSTFQHQAVPPKLVAAVKDLEDKLNADVFFLIQRSQDGEGAASSISSAIADRFVLQRRNYSNGRKKKVLIVDSPGGDARSAFVISTVMQRIGDEFIAVVPRYAKSAATLLVLGAKEILMGDCAELGPLDVQVTELDREIHFSALDEVHSIQRLNAAALEAIDQSMIMLLLRTGKKIDTLLPMTMSFVSSLLGPMIEKIETVHYTRMSRLLKVAEEYGVRLLKKNYSEVQALSIARTLVESYPEHGFVINAEEAREKLKLNVSVPSADIIHLLDTIFAYTINATLIGKIVPVSKE